MKRVSVRLRQQLVLDDGARPVARTLRPEVLARQKVLEFLEPLHRRIADWTRLTVWLTARASRARRDGIRGEAIERDAMALLTEVNVERAEFLRAAAELKFSATNSHIEDVDGALQSLIARLGELVPIKPVSR